MYYDPNCDYFPQRPYESQNSKTSQSYRISQMCCNAECDCPRPQQSYQVLSCGSGQQSCVAKEGVPCVYHQYYQNHCACGKTHYQQVTTMCGNVAEEKVCRCQPQYPRRRNGLDDDEPIRPCPPCAPCLQASYSGGVEDPAKQWPSRQNTSATQYVEPTACVKSLGVQSSQSSVTVRCACLAAREPSRHSMRDQGTVHSRVSVPVDAGTTICECCIAEEDDFSGIDSIPDSDTCDERHDYFDELPVCRDEGVGEGEVTREISEKTVTVSTSQITPSNTTHTQTKEVTRKDVSVTVEPASQSVKSQRSGVSVKSQPKSPGGSRHSVSSAKSQPRSVRTRPANGEVASARSSPRSSPRTSDACSITESKRGPVRSQPTQVETSTRRSSCSSQRSKPAEPSDSKICWKTGKVCLCSSRDGSPAVEPYSPPRVKCFCTNANGKSMVPPGEHYLCCNCLEKANFRVRPKSCKFSVGTGVNGGDFPCQESCPEKYAEWGKPKTRIYKEDGVQCDRSRRDSKTGSDTRVPARSNPIVSETTVNKTSSTYIVKKTRTDTELEEGVECDECNTSGDAEKKKSGKKTRSLFCFKKNKKAKKK